MTDEQQAQRLVEIRARVAKATPGTWGWGTLIEMDDRDHYSLGGHDAEGWPVAFADVVFECDFDQAQANADVIAHAPTDIAALLAALDERDATIAHLEQQPTEPVREEVRRLLGIVGRQAATIAEQAAALERAEEEITSLHEEAVELAQSSVPAGVRDQQGASPSANEGAQG